MRIRPVYVAGLAFFGAICNHEVSLAQVFPVRFQPIPIVAVQDTTWPVVPLTKRRISSLGYDTTSISIPVTSVLVTMTMVDSAKLTSPLFPLHDSKSAALYWGKAELAALQNLNASISTDGLSVYSEFVSDFVVMWGTWFRVGFGALLSKSDSSKTGDSTSSAIQRFMGGGGNALLHVATPVWFVRGNTGWALDVLFAPKFVADLPALDASVTKFSGSVDTGVEVLFFIKSVQENFSFFAQGRISWIVGSGDFYRNLGLNAPFTNGTAMIGIDINNAFRVSAGTILFGPLTSRAPWQVGVQVLAGG